MWYGCGPEIVVEHRTEFSDQQWSGSDTLDARFDITDTLALYDIFVELRHGTDYPNQNVYVKLLTDFPNGARLDQTLSLELANRAGRWFGDCNATDCDFELAIQRNAFFNQLGEHRIRVLPYMRRDPVEEISGFGVRVERNGGVR